MTFNEKNSIEWKLDASYLATTGNMLFYKGTASGYYTLVDGNVMSYGEYTNAFKSISQATFESKGNIEFDTSADAVKAAFKTMDTDIITLNISKVR